MLAHLLAVLVGTGSVSLYLAAFLFPEIHRKHDFIWSGVGFFYALALWIYARQTTGGILVSETAGVALLGWFAWQTFKLRRELVPANQQTSIPLVNQIQQQLGLKPTGVKIPKAEPKTQPKSPAQPTAAKAVNSQPAAMPTPVVPPPVTVTPAPPAPRPEPRPEPRPAPPPAIRTSIPVREQPPEPHPTRPADEAWIELSVKPTAPPKPLTQVLQPQTHQTPPAPAVTDETLSKTSQETIPATVKLDDLNLGG